MGNVNEFIRKAEVEVDFVGREKEKKTIQQLMKLKRLINLYGMKKIGTSALLREVISSMLPAQHGSVYWYKDCDRLDSQGTSVWELLTYIIDRMKQSEELPQLDMKQTDDLEKSFQKCKKCMECQRNAGNNETRKAIESAVKTVTETFVDYIDKTTHDRVIIILDNISVILNNSGKDTFMTFIKNSTSLSEKLSFILTSKDQIQFPSLKYFAALEIEPMEKADILTLVQNKIEAQCEETCDGTHKPREHFEEKDRVYIEVIADLCEGLPLAAITVGTQLCEDDFLMQPAYVVEILITNRLAGLSPDNYPADDRAETYTAVIEDLKPQFANLLKRLNDKMIGTEFDVEETKAAVDGQGSTAPTNAIVVKDYIKPLINQCVMSARNFSRDKKVKLHGILRDCICALDSVQPLPEDDAKKFKHTILKAMRENADRAGLKDISDDVLAEPRLLEQAIKDMVLQNDEQGNSSDKVLIPRKDGHESEHSVSPSLETLHSKDGETLYSRTDITTEQSSHFQLHDFQDIRQESIAGSSLSGPIALPHLPTQESLELPSSEISDFHHLTLSPRYPPTTLSPRYPPTTLSPRYPPTTLSPRYPPTSVLSGTLPQSSYLQSQERPRAQEHVWSIKGS